jgi:hypothetical protein
MSNGTSELSRTERGTVGHCYTSAGGSLIANNHFQAQVALNAPDIRPQVTHEPVSIPPQLHAVYPELSRLTWPDTSSDLYDISLLVPQRLDRIEARGFTRRVEAEKDADGGGEGDRQEDRIGRDDGRPIGQRRHQLGTHHP